ncbi:tRNA guanosine(34) transglycosylase Tgt [Brevibacterium daeguense]|uniref:Queuine tRNA-ribosyltransferase n=1 Tax=Brevibacterium daeguense TaxID=909936 RepID=A0ABP8EKV0_9MICO|nr:tRNA guanosine(34) transglycosylase Tgt [Brevibacterium daeguense]
MTSTQQDPQLDGGDQQLRDGDRQGPAEGRINDRSRFGFEIEARLATGGRAGTIRTPHGDIRTPAFVPVGTKATVKAVRPDDVAALGAQAVLANAYHLYLQPGADIIDEAGGLGAFMGWSGPTFTDSGGFQVMSLGSGFKKVIPMAATGEQNDDAIAVGKERMSNVDEDGVTFKSHLDGTMHRFTAEVSMQVQHQLGADIIFAFDELTTLMNTRGYQEESLERTRRWALRCAAEHQRLTEERSHRPYQALFGVLQGAQYEDLRRKAARDLGAMDFDGFGIGGALEKENLGTIIGWVADELPELKPRHLLGISEPDDLFTAIAAGADTFDCVSPSRVARNAAVYTRDGRFNISGARYRRDFGPIDPECGCHTCQNFSRAYLRHLFKAKEMLFSTLCTIHNEYFIVNLVAEIRQSILDGRFRELEAEVLGRYYA